jgi:hypothetical protein
VINIEEIANNSFMYLWLSFTKRDAHFGKALKQCVCVCVKGAWGAFLTTFKHRYSTSGI